MMKKYFKVFVWSIIFVVTSSVVFVGTMLIRDMKNNSEKVVYYLGRHPDLGPSPDYFFTKEECRATGGLMTFSDARPILYQSEIEKFFSYSNQVCGEFGELLGHEYSDTIGYYCCRYERKECQEVGGWVQTINYPIYPRVFESPFTPSKPICGEYGRLIGGKYSDTIEAHCCESLNPQKKTV